MSRISGGDTKPEILVRKIVYGLGYRFRLHVRNLPGTPDIVLPRHKKVIFVHGCFWHGHKNCKRSNRPSTNIKFWNKKINQNIGRDNIALAELKKQGWKSLVVWQCQTRNQRSLEKRLFHFLKRRSYKWVRETS